ncbi:MAG: HlyC/CorC family transporter [Oscillospiraceae bacterium]|nr:HlyC/CorC family transporter [Oscillospiraceae bacterium]
MLKDILLRLLLQLILIALNAVFASAEIAVISMNDAKLAALASSGNKKAARLAKITASPAKFLATIQVAITLSGFLGSAFAADYFADLLTQRLLEAGATVSKGTLDTVFVIAITLVLSYFTLVFGELVPKRIAMKRAESLSLGMSGMLSVISKIFAPIVWFLSVSTNAVLRLFGIDPNEQDATVTEEEIRMMIDAGSEKGTIDEDEKELLQNVFEFDDLTAGEIATHRTDVAILWLEEPDEWSNTIIESRHTIFPVCEETVDNIVGVVNAKDYFAMKSKTGKADLKKIMRAPYLVPDSVRADVLFNNLKKKRESFAVVLDEHGGMEGVVTITDILECIVGDFDEDTLAENNGQPDIVKTEENLWQISGGTPVDDVCEELEVSISDEDFDTFGGYVLSILGAIPADDTHFTVEDDNLIIKVTSVKEHRIEMTLVQKKIPEEADEE